MVSVRKQRSLLRPALKEKKKKRGRFLLGAWKGIRKKKTYIVYNRRYLFPPSLWGAVDSPRQNSRTFSTFLNILLNSK